MQTLVTGGAGFLGGALVRQLVALGHDVRVVDDLSAGDPARLPEEASFSRGDVNDLPRLWTLLQGVECVYHLAARVSVQESVRYPRDAFPVTERLIEGTSQDQRHILDSVVRVYV